VDQNFVRDLSIGHMIKLLRQDDADKIVLVSSIFRNASAVSTKCFEPHVTSLVYAAEYFKDPLTLAVHLDTLFNLS